MRIEIDRIVRSNDVVLGALIHTIYEYIVREKEEKRTHLIDNFP